MKVKEGITKQINPLVPTNSQKKIVKIRDHVITIIGMLLSFTFPPQ
jgi:hypothetical protein